jgi:replicative DNA helicase
MPIYQTNTLIKAQTQILKQYQSGKVRIVRTARPHIDATLTGLLPGDIVVIAGASGAGKTFELQTLRENIMSKEINPDADDYVFLDYSFEMKLFNLILRGVSKILGKKKKDVLLTEFTEDERPLANRYIKTLTDNRFFNYLKPCKTICLINPKSLIFDQTKGKRSVFF